MATVEILRQVGESDIEKFSFSISAMAENRSFREGHRFCKVCFTRYTAANTAPSNNAKLWLSSSFLLQSYDANTSLDSILSTTFRWMTGP